MKTSENLNFIIVMPRPIRWGIKRWWPSSVYPSVCPMPDPKLRMEGHSKLKISRKKAHGTSDP